MPASIRLNRPLNLGEPRGEHELLTELKTIASKNKVFASFIGMGYYDTITPPVIQRNILENPGLVHAVHALPGRDLAGPARSAAEFPDDDRGSDRLAAGQRQPAG